MAWLGHSNTTHHNSSLTFPSQLKNGQFWGLSTISRSGDTSFTVVDNTTELTAMLSLNSPRAHYDARAEFMGIGVTLSLVCTSSYYSSLARWGPVPRLLWLTFKYTLT